MKLRSLCWWIALAAFVGLGLLRWSQFFIAKAPDLGAPNAGLDAMARRHFGLEDGASVLRREMESFPVDVPLLVAGPGKDWTLTEAHHLISYLAWPRPVWCIGLVPAGEKAAFDYPPPPGLKPAGIFFYKTGAPDGLSTHVLSEQLSVGEVAP